MIDYQDRDDPDFWPNIMAELERAGVTRPEIRKRTGASFSTISRWANGPDQPRYRRAAMLLALAKAKGIPVTEVEKG